MFAVGIAVKRQHGDRLVQRVDDPVFGDAGLGVVARFLLGVALGPIGADDLNDKSLGAIS